MKIVKTWPFPLIKDMLTVLDHYTALSAPTNAASNVVFCIVIVSWISPFRRDPIELSAVLDGREAVVSREGECGWILHSLGQILLGLLRPLFISPPRGLLPPLFAVPPRGYCQLSLSNSLKGVLPPHPRLFF
jgi:hypothetical protein